MIKIHSEREFSPESIEILKENVPFPLKITGGNTIVDPESAEILIAGNPSPEMMKACTNLRMVIIPWAGVPLQTRELLKEFPHVQLYNLHHNASTTAELAIGLLFAAAKSIVPMDMALREKDWRPRYENPFVMRLEEKKTLIFGYGSIGAHVGKVLRALGMDVWGIRRSIDGDYMDPWGVEVTTKNRVGELLSESDVLMIAAPLTEETRGFFDQDMIALMKPGSILVNIGRGEIVDEKALYEALRDKKIAGAGIDVWYNYPSSETTRGFTPPSVFPFHRLENVVLSPHRGGLCNESEPLRMAALGNLINQYIRGGEMPNQIDKELGY